MKNDIKLFIILSSASILHVSVGFLILNIILEDAQIKFAISAEVCTDFPSLIIGYETKLRIFIAYG